MTEGHRHRHLEVKPGGFTMRLLTRPVWTIHDRQRVEKSPYPYRPLDDGSKTPPYVLSGLGILHRWTGLTLKFPDKEGASDERP